MNRKEVLDKRNKISDEIEMINKIRDGKKYEGELNKKINDLKKQYTFYNELLKKI